MKITFLSLTSIVASAAISQAAIISLNFAGGGNSGTVDAGRVTDLLPADSVGAPGFVATNWNNLKTDWSGNPGAVPASIVDSNGTPTGINIGYDTGDTWRTDLNEATSADHKLFKRYFDDSGTAGQSYLNVVGVPNAALGYSVVLYLASDAADAGANVQMGSLWLQNQQADAGPPSFRMEALRALRCCSVTASLAPTSTPATAPPQETTLYLVV